jgi:hypothetical protein
VLEGGRYFEGCKAVDPSTDARDAEVAARLWAETKAWVTA